MKKMTAAVLVCLFALLLSSGGAWADYGSPVREFSRGGEKWYEFLNPETSQFYEMPAREIDSPFRRADNAAPEEGGCYWKSTLVSQSRDAYSLKRPAGNATVATAVMPASLPKFSKGATWGIVAVSQKSGKIVRGKITPAAPDNKAGQQPAVVVFEEPVEAGSKLVASDRWYNNSYFSDKRGELAIWNPGTASWQKLVGGMWLERDPKHMALVAKTYGAPLEQLRHATVSPTEAEQISKKLGFKKIASPDGVRYTPVDISVFKKLYAKPSLVRWHQRFANNGGLAIGIPPTAIGTAVGVGVAGVLAFADTNHNIPCLSTMKGGQSRFERDQKFYESGGALTSRDFERAKRGPALPLGQQYGQKNANLNPFGGQNFQNGNTEMDDILLAQIQPVSPTGYPQAYNWPGFWLEPKRVEWPSGGGMFTSPQLRTEYAFSNTHLHLFGGEIAPNATFHFGPHLKMDRWKYRTDTGYHGHGQYIGAGFSAELVTRHKWGGTDSRFSFAYGHQWDKGKFHHDRRAPWMFEWQTELWWQGIQLGKDGKYGQLLSGAKIGTLAKTNDFLLLWLFPTIYKGPYDLGKISIGWQFLHLFDRFGNEPKGGGLGILFEPIDGLGYRFSYFPFKRGVYHTGWIDPYRVYAKLKELEAEFGIYGIPWDPYVPKATRSAISAVPPPIVLPPITITASPLPALSPKKCAVEKKAKKKYKKIKRVKQAEIKKKEVKKETPPCKPEVKPPLPESHQECRQNERIPKVM